MFAFVALAVLAHLILFSRKSWPWKHLVSSAPRRLNQGPHMTDVKVAESCSPTIWCLDNPLCKRCMATSTSHVTSLQSLVAVLFPTTLNINKHIYCLLYYSSLNESYGAFGKWHKNTHFSNHTITYCMYCGGIITEILETL